MITIWKNPRGSGGHTGLVEELRSLRDAKVSIVSSDIKGDMNLLMNIFKTMSPRH